MLCNQSEYIFWHYRLEHFVKHRKLACLQDGICIHAYTMVQSSDLRVSERQLAASSPNMHLAIQAQCFECRPHWLVDAGKETRLVEPKLFIQYKFRVAQVVCKRVQRFIGKHVMNPTARKRVYLYVSRNVAVIAESLGPGRACAGMCTRTRGSSFHGCKSGRHVSLLSLLSLSFTLLPDYQHGTRARVQERVPQRRLVHF